MWLAAANLAFLAASAGLYLVARRWMLRAQAPGRGLELRACALAALLTTAGFALAQVGVNYSLTGHARFASHKWLVFALTFSAALLAAHLLLRLQRSRVDQLLLPVAAFLTALGLINVYVWEVRDSNAYVSTVALPALREYKASIAGDRSMDARERRASLESIGPVPNELDYERDEQNRSRDRFATVLDSHWLETYNGFANHLQGWLRAHPDQRRGPAIHEVRPYSALQKQLLVAAFCLLLVPALLFAAARLHLLSLRRRKETLWAGGFVLLAVTAALLLQSNESRLPALLRFGDQQIAVYDPLKLGLIVVLALAIGRVVTDRLAVRDRAVLFALSSAGVTVAVMLVGDFGSGVVLLGIVAFMVILVGGRKVRHWAIAYGTAAICIAPLAVSASGFPLPDTARSRLEMWADPWKTYQRRELTNAVAKSASKIVQRRLAIPQEPPRSPIRRLFTTQHVWETQTAERVKTIASLVRADVSHIEQELRWRLDALRTDTPNAAPFVPGPDPAEMRDLLEAEELWSDLGGRSSDTDSKKEMRLLEAGVNDAIVQLRADTDRHIARLQKAAPGPGSHVLEQQLARAPPQPTNFQIQRSLFALRAGGALGVGLGLGKPEALPAVTEDVPLASLGEALGFAGIGVIALLILLITVRAIQRGWSQQNPARALMLVGVGAVLGMQAFLGMGAISGIVPFSGLTFPFLSRSGTALISNFAALTLMMALAAPLGPPPASRELAPIQGSTRGLARLLNSGGLTAAFAIVLASLACVQLAGRMLAPGALFTPLPTHSAPILHAEDAWARPSYRVAPGPILDRYGSVLAKTTSLGGQRVYPDAEVATTLAQTLPQLDASYRSRLTRPAGGSAKRQGGSPPIGSTLVTTIDSDLQRQVHQAFDQGAAEGGLGGVERLRGAAVVLDARNGDIVALDSRPTLSLIELSSRGAWVNAEAADRRVGLPYRNLNRVVHGYYPPGSVLKTITAAAGMESGLHSLHSRDFDYRSGKKGPRPPDGLLQLGRWHQLPLADGPPITSGNHPDLKDWEFSLETAYAWSCNIAFAEVGLELGPTRFIDFARRFGFERKVDVPGLGTMFSTLDNDSGDSPASRYLGRSKSNLARTAFGQAQVRATPLQMALMAGAIANGGDVVQPRLVAGWRTAGGQWIERVPARSLQRTGLSRRTMNAMRAMMHASATYGWARKAKLNRENSNPGVAGKTGSAEWSEKPDAAHSWFVGYFPAESPRVAIALVVERGGLGPTVAVRIARHIFAAPALHSYVSAGRSR